MKDEIRNVDDGAKLADAFDGASRRILTVDVEKYQALLDGSGLSEDQREEFLRAVWSVVVTFVELGFGVHPLQEVCGKESESVAASPKEAFDEVNSKTLPEPTTKRESGPEGGLEAK